MQAKVLTKIDEILAILIDPDHIEWSALTARTIKVAKQWLDIMDMVASIQGDHDDKYEYLYDLYKKSLNREYCDERGYLFASLARKIYTLTLGIAGDKVTINYLDDWREYGYERIPLNTPGYTVKSWKEISKELPDFQGCLIFYEVRHNGNGFEVICSQDDIDEELEG